MCERATDQHVIAAPSMLNDEVWTRHLDRVCAIIYIPPFARRRMERHR
jgi:hypothetical protein